MNENLSAIQIGSRIKEKLEEFQLKQKDLVDLTNLSKNAISNYISGNRIPDTKAIYKISKALNTPIEWFLTGEETTSEEKTDNVSSVIEEFTSEEMQILQLFRQLSDRDKIKIEGIMEAKIDEAKQDKRGLSSNYQSGEEAATREKKHA